MSNQTLAIERGVDTRASLRESCIEFVWQMCGVIDVMCYFSHLQSKSLQLQFNNFLLIPLMSLVGFQVPGMVQLH